MQGSDFVCRTENRLVWWEGGGEGGVRPVGKVRHVLQ